MFEKQLLELKAPEEKVGWSRICSQDTLTLLEELAANHRWKPPLATTSVGKSRDPAGSLIAVSRAEGG